MKNRNIRYIEGVIIEETKLIKSLQTDFDESTDFPDIQMLCQRLIDRSRKALTGLKFTIIELEGSSSTALLPIDPLNEEYTEPFFEHYHKHLSLISISYETLLFTAAGCNSPRLADLAMQNLTQVSKALSDISRIASGYEAIAALKDLRHRLLASC